MRAPDSTHTIHQANIILFTLGSYAMTDPDFNVIVCGPTMISPYIFALPIQSQLSVTVHVPFQRGVHTFASTGQTINEKPLARSRVMASWRTKIVGSSRYCIGLLFYACYLQRTVSVMAPVASVDSRIESPRNCRVGR